MGQVFVKLQPNPAKYQDQDQDEDKNEFDAAKHSLVLFLFTLKLMKTFQTMVCILS